MRICFPNQKGGVGKTTLLAEVAFSLNARGSKVLMIDLDHAQGNLTDWMLGYDFTGVELADVFNRDAELDQALREIKPGLDLLPCVAVTGKLTDWSEGPLMRGAAKPLEFVLDQVSSAYEYVLLDSGPSFGIMNRHIYSRCEILLPVLSPEKFSVKGVNLLRNNLAKINREFMTDVSYQGLIVNMYDKRQKNVHGKAVNALCKLSLPVFVVPLRTAVPMAQEENIAVRDVLHGGTKDVTDIVDKIAGVLLNV